MEQGKWLIGGYIRFTHKYGDHPKGTIAQITENVANCVTVDRLLYEGSSSYCVLYKNDEAEWIGMTLPTEINNDYSIF